VEIVFPFEFNVFGTPVSLQAKRPASRLAWKKQVRQASLEVLPEGHFCSDASISVTLFYFPDAPMQGDIDNIVKPVLDALCRHIYLDDRQVERVWVQKFDPGKVFQFSTPSAALAGALDGGKPVLYVRLSNDPAEGLA
jgi:hypothetical protein